MSNGIVALLLGRLNCYILSTMKATLTNRTAVMNGIPNARMVAGFWMTWRIRPVR
jgi:hypothetical protein